MLNEFTSRHLNAWLNKVHESERDAVLTAILLLAANDPELLESHSWDELRRMSGN